MLPSSKNQSIRSILTPEFMQLDRLLKRFNVFDATDMRRREVKHTKFLAHLLNPNESHGLGIRFLENFIHNLNNESGFQAIDFLSLDLMNAQILSEVNLESASRKGKTIDLLILIPNLTHDSKNILIAIEAKVDSKESLDQLGIYRKLIDENFNKDFIKHFYFLTTKGDEPSDKEWTGVTFGNVVVPTIETLTSYYKDTISDYLISIIDDYIEVIDGSHIKESEADRLAEQISQDTLTLIKSLKQDAPFKSPERILQSKFSAAIDFLKTFDSDPRKRITSEYESLFKDKTHTGIFFKHESSSRQYLRLSLISNENEVFLQKICSQSKPQWVSSKRHLAFEFVLKVAAMPKKINVQLKFTLGPTNESFTQRQGLANCISKAAFEFFRKNTDEEWSPSEKNVSPVYSTLISSRELSSFTKNNLDSQSTIDFIKVTMKDESLINLANAIDAALTTFRVHEFFED